MVKEHMGNIIKEAVRKSGKTVKQVAYELGISRNTLYSKFKLPYIGKDFILKVGSVLHYDFSSYLPKLNEYSKDFKFLWRNLDKKEEYLFVKKYFVLLENYNQLLMFLIKISNMKNIDFIKDEINRFIKNNKY